MWRLWEMAVAKGHALIVAGNVYFCDFHKIARSRSSDVPVQGSARDVRLTAETLQGACRDLIAAAPSLVRRAEINAADLVSVASMIDEVAFHAHVMALDSNDASAPAMDAGELQQLLLEGAAVTVEIQSCMSEAGAAAEQIMKRLRAQAERALHLGRGVAEALDAAATDKSPTMY